MIKYILCLVLVIALMGGAYGLFHLYRVAVRNKNEMKVFQGDPIQVTRNFGKALVIYYSFSGHTADIAKRIQAKTNADLYEIKTVEPLPKMPLMYMAIKNQLKTKKYPQLKQDFPNFEEYDVIFVGSPVWWYTVSTPVLSFLNQVDFKGKKVVPFSTQGSNVGSYLNDFKHNARNAQMLKYEKFNNMPAQYDPAVDNKISTWLNELDI